MAVVMRAIILLQLLLLLSYECSVIHWVVAREITKTLTAAPAAAAARAAEPTLLDSMPQQQSSSVNVKHNPTTACFCHDDDSDGQELHVICASNGITYKNLCQFQCAKSKVPRLRKVKEGPCTNNMIREDFWKSARPVRTAN